MSDPNDNALVAADAHLPPGDGRPRSLAVVESTAVSPLRSQQLQPNEAAGYLMLGSQQWAQLKDQCTMLVSDGALHRSIGTPGKAMVIAMKAIEMGVPLTSAWTGMRFIDGEVCILGKLALRLIQQRVVALGGTCKPIEVPRGEDWDRAGWLMGRPGEDPVEYWFTMKDAERAGLLRMKGRDGKWFDTPAYKKYGNRMLRWRALATGAAYEFADILQGCMLAEEMEHKDQQFIAGQVRQAPLPPAPQGTPNFHDGQRERVELDRTDPEVEKVCQLVGQFAQRFAALEATGDTDPEACYKEARRAKWNDLTERCIRGHAPTQEEARMCQQILTADIRRLDESIRNRDLEAAHAAQKESNDDDQQPPAEPTGGDDPRPA